MVDFSECHNDKSLFEREKTGEISLGVKITGSLTAKLSKTNFTGTIIQKKHSVASKKNSNKLLQR